MCSHKILQPYASNPDKTRGRMYPEKESRHRSAFQRDRDRIIHASAFRRLKHKTQVFVENEGDYYRTRLTHSLEVAQIARTCARHLGVNEDLSEAIALAHDLGHPPFGHAGEEILNKLGTTYGGFDHNIQAMRIVTKLEAHYAAFDGLNLCWETRDGLVKHNGALANPTSILEKICNNHHIDLKGFSSIEAQIAALADDIAYNTHDIDDGLRAKFFTLDELQDIRLLQPAFKEVDKMYPDLSHTRRHHEIVRRLYGYLVEDLLRETQDRLTRYNIKTVHDVRCSNVPVVAFSQKMTDDLEQLRTFLFHRMYRHYTVNRMTGKATRIISGLYQSFMETPHILPPEWAHSVAISVSTAHKARVVIDYIAGMTDRYAIKEYQSIIEPI